MEIFHTFPNFKIANLHSFIFSMNFILDGLVVDPGSILGTPGVIPEEKCTLGGTPVRCRALSTCTFTPMGNLA